MKLKLTHSIYSIEEDVQFPVKPDSKVQLMKAKADILISKPIPQKLQDRIDEELERINLLREALQCMKLQKDKYKVLLGVFFGEWKTDVGVEIACRQAAFSALSIQSQRRALSLKDRVVYGLVFAGSFLYLVMAFWQDDVLVG